MPWDGMPWDGETSKTFCVTKVSFTLNYRKMISAKDAGGIFVGPAFRLK